jgi:hypothetical protein
MDGHWLLLADLHGTWRGIASVSGDDAEHIINTLPIWTFSRPQSTERDMHLSDALSMFSVREP